MQHTVKQIVGTTKRKRKIIEIWWDFIRNTWIWAHLFHDRNNRIPGFV